MTKAVFHIPEDTDMIPVNDQTRPPEELVAMIREALTQLAGARHNGVQPVTRGRAININTDRYRKYAGTLYRPITPP